MTVSLPSLGHDIIQFLRNQPRNEEIEDVKSRVQEACFTRQSPSTAVNLLRNVIEELEHAGFTRDNAPISLIRKQIERLRKDQCKILPQESIWQPPAA
jgi:hypothetical protein